MKKFIILIFLFLISCEVYQEPTSLSLSGEYVITKVTLLSTENTTNNSGVIYNPGSHYINPYDIFPIDDIQVGFTRWHLDYSVISFFPLQLGNGTTQWQRQYYYSIVGHNNIYDLGYLQFYYWDAFILYLFLNLYFCLHIYSKTILLLAFHYLPLL